MIEINISINTAAKLLIERMEVELKFRQRNNMINETSTLNNLSHLSLLSIAETAAFDLVSMLPADLLVKTSNLSIIVCKAIQSLSKIYYKNEFENYSNTRADALIKPIKNAIKKYDKEYSFLNN